MSATLGTRTRAGVWPAPPWGGALTDLGDPRFRAFARRLRRRTDLIYAQALESVDARVGAGAHPSGLGPGRIAELIRGVLAAQLRLFSTAAPAERLADGDALPPAVLSEVADFELVLFAFRATQMSLWNAWFTLVEEDGGLTDEERRALLARGSDLFFSYANFLSGRAVELFRRQTDGLRLAPEQREARAFRALLAGDPLAAASISFDFGRHHLGLIAWDGDDPLATVTELAKALARPLFTLKLAGRGEECWAWISGTRPLATHEESLLASWHPDRTRLAVGLEGFGEAGFRATHRQAERARRLIAAGTSDICRYDDIVVEVLATENEPDARAFVAHELRGIDDDSPTSVRLRETLLAYFRPGQNAASTGARLGVHQQTVANRLRATEERLGHASIGTRRVELEVALRLREHLGGKAGPAGRAVATPPAF